MLVLSRKKGDHVTIGDNIVVKVLRVKGNTVQLGIEAPRDVRIVRGELENETEQKELTVLFDNSNAAIAHAEFSVA